MDVTDRMSLPRTRAPRDISSAPGLSPSSELKKILDDIVPLPGSGNLSPKEVDEIMQSTAKIIGDNNADWMKRLNMMKTFRSLCVDPNHHPQIIGYLRHMMPPLQGAIKDPRSQVSRDGCLTFGVIATQLGTKVDSVLEPYMPTLFSLLVANAKVVSITGANTIHLVYEVVPSWRLIPVLHNQILSKSKDVRRAVCATLKLILAMWPQPPLVRQANVLQDIIKKALSDADAEARLSARDSFPDFQRIFPVHAANVIEGLDNLQKRQLLQSSQAPLPPPRTNGTHPSNSLTRQSSMSLRRTTGIPVLTSRTPGSPAGRSTSAIDLQAANRAKTHHFSTLRTPLRVTGRTQTMQGVSVNPQPQFHTTQYTPAQRDNDERSRNRTRISRLSQSQPGSRSNSPSSKFAYATYNNTGHEGSPGVTSPPGRGIRRLSTSSASSSRDTSPSRNPFVPKIRTRSLSQSPHPQLTNNSSTAKLLVASREAESLLADAIRRDMTDGDGHSDSEDSLSSHRSYLSETFSPPSSGRHFFVEEKVEDLLNRCGSAKWSERKEGLLGLQTYLERHGSIPPQHFNRIGQTFCRIFMDAHTKVLSLFLDVLHAVLVRHARDLVDFTTILLNRVLTKVGSDLLHSVHSKLMKTLEIIMDEMPADLQFSAVAHYLSDPTITPNTRSRTAALYHLLNLSMIQFSVKVDQLQSLVEKILDWSGDMRNHELRKISQKVFHSLFGMAAPQMTLVLSNLPPAKQDAAKAILKNIEPTRDVDERPDTTSGWNSINSDIQALRLASEADLVSIISQMSLALKGKKAELVGQLHQAIKDSDDRRLMDHHKEVLKVLVDALSETTKSGEKSTCFKCLDELCGRKILAQPLSSFAELLIVRVTDVQTPDTPREIVKAAENCGLTVAENFPPDSLVRALCTIVQTKEYPVNQMAIKMLQRCGENAEVSKLRVFLKDIMGTLIGAYDHSDSAVRKAAVFAIVALHKRFGEEELQPYLCSLSGSKLKLLQLYIQRTSAQSPHN